MYDSEQVKKIMKTYENLINCHNLYNEEILSSLERSVIGKAITEAEEIPDEIKDEKFKFYINNLKGMLELKTEKKYTISKSKDFGRIINHSISERKSFSYKNMNTFIGDLKNYMKSNKIKINEIQIGPSFSNEEKEEIEKGIKWKSW